MFCHPLLPHFSRNFLASQLTVAVGWLAVPHTHLYMTRTISDGSFSLGCTSGAHLYATGSASGGSFFHGPHFELYSVRISISLLYPLSIHPITLVLCVSCVNSVSTLFIFNFFCWLAHSSVSHALLPSVGVRQLTRSLVTAPSSY